MSVWKSSVRVLTADADNYGIVYYANYLKYFEIGRTEFFRNLDWPITHYIAQDHYPIIIEAACRYFAPAHYDDVLEIECRLVESDRLRMKFEYRVINENGQLIVSGYTEHVLTNSMGKLKRFPKDFVERMQKLLEAKEERQGAGDALSEKKPKD